MIPSPSHLCPIPKEARANGRALRLEAARPLQLQGPIDRADIAPAVERLQVELAELGARPAVELNEADGLAVELGPAVELCPQNGHGQEGYALVVGSDGIVLSYETPVGAFRGLTTLAQWLRLQRPVESGILTVHGVDIRDRPDFEHRGLLLDVSRNRVPTMDELRALIDRMADLKYNQLQLYTEHTFAYRGHERVWQGWDPITPEEILEIARYAGERRIEWVPNQNCFGHLHRWLIHEPYRRLAESPEGIEHPFSLEREPFSLCPTDPGSLELLDDLLAQLLPLSGSTLFNANLDETLDLGLGRSQEICRERGTERVYLDFVHAIHRRVRAHGKRLMMWGDIILKRPDLIEDLPQDAVLLEWGYEADHPFEQDCARFAASGRELYVCPGTSAWSSFSGRTDNAIQNLAAAAVHGRAHAAAGYMVTDWGDHGHLQPPIIGRPGLFAGACFSWNSTTAEQPDSLPLAEMLDRHLFRVGHKGAQAGRALLDLGRVQDETGVRPLNGSPFFFEIMQAHLPSGERRSRGMSPASIRKALGRLDEVMAAWSGHAVNRPDAELLTRELEWVAQALRFGAHLGLARLAAGEDRPLADLQPTTRRALDRELHELCEALSPIWSARSRPGGLDASIARLTALRSLWPT